MPKLAEPSVLPKGLQNRSLVRQNYYYRKCSCKTEYSMSNEKTDEFLSWRRRLAPPDALPDQGLDDKEVSWERLAERLREKPRRRTGYWIAAACLLLALMPATHFFRDRPARGAGVARVSHHS